MDYVEQALNFCQQNKIYIHSRFLGCAPHFPSDTVSRNRYSVTFYHVPELKGFIAFEKWLVNAFNHGLGWSDYCNFVLSEFDHFAKNNPNAPTFKIVFGDSIANTETKKTPTFYDYLASLTHYDPETFTEFCSEYGYDEDSRKALETYLNVQKEWLGVRKVFGHCLDELREIV